MRIIESLKISFKNIKNNKLRSILTMLGLIIGVASVIVLVGIGNGATSSVTSEVKSLGTDILTVGVTSSSSYFTYDQMDEILKLDNVKAVAPYKSVSDTVSRGTTTASEASILATNASYLDVTNIEIKEGRTISQIDVENKSKVCILGYSTAETLFNLADPVGQTIKIDGDNYTVIGILPEQGTSMGTDVDSMVLMPITTAKYLGEDTNITKLYVKVSDDSKISSTQNVIENYIRSNLQISSDYYSVETQSSVLSTMQNISSTLSLMLGGIASISLIVGGIGVMNVMLVSVTERTKEIGIRKSLGAKRRDILFQFLIEALVLSLLGGIIGVLLAFGIGTVTEKIGYTFEPGTFVVLIAFASSAIIGLVFGIFPAYRAASLNPIDALRTE